MEDWEKAAKRLKKVKNKNTLAFSREFARVTEKYFGDVAEGYPRGEAIGEKMEGINLTQRQGIHLLTALHVRHEFPGAYAVRCTNKFLTESQQRDLLELLESHCLYLATDDLSSDELEAIRGDDASFNKEIDWLVNVGFDHRFKVIEFRPEKLKKSEEIADGRHNLH